MYRCKIHSYCLTSSCPKCSGKAELVKVQAYGHEDKFGEYRRKAKWQLNGK
jgi:rRNA maturation protein Nop10